MNGEKKKDSAPSGTQPANEPNLPAQNLAEGAMLVAVLEIEHSLAAARNKDLVYKSLKRGIERIFPDAATFFISSFDSERRIIKAVYGSQDGVEVDVASLPEIPLAPDGEGTQSRVIHTRQPLIIASDLKKNFRSGVIVQVGGKDERTTQSALYVPMLAHDSVMGVIQLQSYLPNRFSEKDAQALTLIANTAAVSIQNMRLYETAQIEIEERRQAEEALRQSEAHYRTLVETLNVSLCRWKPDTTLTFANEKYRRIFGIQGNSAGVKWLDFLPAETRASTATFYEEVAASPRVVTYEHPVVAEDGSRRHYQWVDTPIFDEKGNLVEFQSVGIDINERKQAEELAQAQLDLARIIGTMTASQKVWSICLEVALRVSGMDSGGLYLFDEKQEAFELVYHQGLGADFIQGVTRYTADTPNAKMILEGKMLSFAESEVQSLERNRKEGLRSLIVVPILHQGQALGNLNIGSHSMTSAADYAFARHALETVAAEVGNILIFMRNEKTSKKNAQLLRESEEKYRGLLESMDNVISTIDYEGNVLYMNDIAASQLGGSARELTGKTLQELFPSEAAAQQLAMTQKVIREDRAAIFESRSFTKGKARWYRTSIQPIHDESGRVSHALVNATDIDDLKAAQQELQELNRTLEERVNQRTAEVQDLYDNSPAGYHSLDASGRIIMINQTHLHWMGYTRDETLGRPMADFLTPSSVSNFQELFQKFTQQGTVRDLELELRRKDGSAIPVLVNATAIYDEQGRYLMSRSTVFDHTERKAAEESMRRVNLELERALRMKDEFLANMSHELRTPLNAILGLSESLLEQVAGSINEKQQKYLGAIHESGRHLLELINDILDLAKVEAGQTELDISSVDAQAIFESSLRMIKQLAHKKKQTVEADIEKEIGYIWADERRVKQMIVNLLSNAVKFTPVAGRLGLTARVKREENKLSITVWDHGIGISANDLERLFQPFVQVDSSLSRETSGTGLGLALVSKMARMHGGSVEVETQPAVGSRFTVNLPWLPVAPADIPDQTNQAESQSETDENSHRLTVLLVEDTESIVMLISDYLEKNGFRVESSNNGFDGVAKAASLKPDLILMDVMMPGMDGFEAAKRIRQQESLRQTPIIALTALAMPNDRERCMAAGMNDYLSKPIHLGELVKMLKRYSPASQKAAE